ncbi:MAG: tetratricopeptide repeat protein [Chloroflexaceae bacterium]|nr:tetratricopeptide repeat protein [Chloroflexaceae bacterium]
MKVRLPQWSIAGAIVGAILLAVVGLTIWGSPLLAMLYLTWGDRLLEQEKYQEAGDAYGQALLYAPESQPAQLQLGRVLFLQQQWQAALQAYQQALENQGDRNLDPDLTFTLEQLGQQLEAEGQFEQALQAFQLALQLNGDRPAIYLHLGKLFLAKDDFEQAIEPLQQAIARDPNHAEAHYQLGNAFYGLENYKKAIATFEQAIALNPNRADFQHHLGQAFKQHRRFNKAIAALERSLSLDGTKGLVYQDLCFALHEKRRFQEAVQRCEQALARNTHLAGARFYLQEIPRLLARQQNPAVFSLPERLPSAAIDPLLRPKRSIVRVIVQSSASWSTGTGWIVKRNQTQAWVVTNRHVVDKAVALQDLTLEVEFFSAPPQGQFRWRSPAQILHKTSKQDSLDLAVLLVENLPPDIQALPLANSSSPYQPIRVIGHPQGTDGWQVSEGEIRQQILQKLELSAMLASGNSGSPVLNWDNQVVGLVTEVGFLCQQIQPGQFALNCSLAHSIAQVREQLQAWKIL